MSQPIASPALARSSATPAATDTRLLGRWLLIARIVWMAVVVFTLSIFLLSLPAYFAQLQTICTGDLCIYSYGQLTPGTAEAIQQVGLSIGGYAASVVALSSASTLVSFGIGGLLFWRRSDDWMALLVSLFLVTFGVNFISQGQHENQQAALVVPFTILTILGWLSLNLLLYLFPTGQFVPRWTRLLAVFMVAFNILLNAFPEAFLSLIPWAISAIFSGLGVCGVVAQVYRYARVSGTVQRQQTKWILFGVAGTVVVILGRYVPILIAPFLSTSSPLYFLVATYLYPLGLLFIPLTLSRAILRYRLWDIDTLINKALVYGLLTGLLGALYAGLIIGLESLAGLFIGQTASNPLVLVISTLAIAALFQPLRRRIQSVIDRRFYRKKYDAEKTLAAFSATLRNEVDLNQLHEQVLVVVQEAMQPAHVSLWLRQPHQRQQSEPPEASESFMPGGAL